MSPRPVLFVTSEFPPSGAGIGVFVQSLQRVLVLRGRDCWVATRGKIPDVDLARRIIRIPFVPFPRIGDKVFSQAFGKFLKNSTLDNPIVNVHSPYPQAGIACDLATFHIVVKKVLSQGQFVGLKRAQYRLGLPILCRNEEALLGSKSICAVSNAVAEDLRDEYDFDREVGIVGNGVDSSFFKPGSRSSEPRVLYVGRLDLNKGVLDFVRMAKLVTLRFPAVKFRMIGRGGAHSLIVKEIRRLKLEKSLDLLGYVPSEVLLEEYQKAWVYVSPTRFEGFATSILEAMACGTLPVVSDIPSNREILKPEEALFSRSKSIGEYASCVMWALSNQDQADRMAKEARNHAMLDYSWEKVASRYDTILDSLDQP